MHGSEIHRFILHLGGVFDFFKKLIYTSNLESYDVVEGVALKTVNGLTQAISISFPDVLSITIRSRNGIVIFKYSYIKCLI
jgi:hypothetical protein